MPIGVEVAAMNLSGQWFLVERAVDADQLVAQGSERSKRESRLRERQHGRF
jgi:hypothetical protein